MSEQITIRLDMNVLPWTPKPGTPFAISAQDEMGAPIVQTVTDEGCCAALTLTPRRDNWGSQDRTNYWAEIGNGGMGFGFLIPERDAAVAYDYAEQYLYMAEL